MDTIHYGGGIYIHMHANTTRIICIEPPVPPMFVVVDDQSPLSNYDFTLKPALNTIHRTPYNVCRSNVRCPDCGIQFQIFELENQWIYYSEYLIFDTNGIDRSSEWFMWVHNEFSAHFNTFCQAKWICLRWNTMNLAFVRNHYALKVEKDTEKKIIPQQKKKKKMDFANKIKRSVRLT